MDELTSWFTLQVDKAGNTVPFESMPPMLNTRCTLTSGGELVLSTPSVLLVDGVVKISDMIPQGKTLSKEIDNATLEVTLDTMNPATYNFQISGGPPEEMEFSPNPLESEIEVKKFIPR